MNNPEPILIKIDPEIINKLHQAYRYALCSENSSPILFDREIHNVQLSQMLSRLMTQKYLIKEKIPFTLRTNSNPNSEVINHIWIGGRPVRFILGYARGEPSMDSSPKLFLTRQQIEALEERDDINIFGVFFRNEGESPRKFFGAYYAFPAGLSDVQTAESSIFLISSSIVQNIMINILDKNGTPTEMEINLIPDTPKPVALDPSRIKFLFSSESPLSDISISIPGISYLKIKPSDWTPIGFDPQYLMLIGYRSSLDLRIINHRNLSIDTQYRIRYFKTQKVEIDRRALRGLSGLFDYAKLFDQGG